MSDVGAEKLTSVIRPPSSEGAIAQLGERLNGIQEVGGSTPPGSTSSIRFLVKPRLVISPSFQSYGDFGGPVVVCVDVVV